MKYYEAPWDDLPKHRPILESALGGRQIIYKHLDVDDHALEESPTVKKWMERYYQSTAFAVSSFRPLTSKQASQPCNLITQDELKHVLPLKGDFEKVHMGKEKLPLLEYVHQEKVWDLGTLMAHIATVEWMEGRVVTAIADDRKHLCPIQPRPKGTLGSGVIEQPYYILPRRLWDLVSNRVVDVDQFAKVDGETAIPRAPAQGYWAITHSWTADMQLCMTPINGYRWPVPVPAGVSLEAIRWEALSHGAQYCWLDVLCLRQRMIQRVPGTTAGIDDETESAEREQRLEEWSVDIPTIGNIYRQATNVIRYFNGLGRELQLSGWDDPRHWINRAWTLQETRAQHAMVNGGIPDGMHTPLQQMVQVAGTSRTIREVLAPLTWLVEDAEREYEPDVTPSPFDMLTQVPSFMQAAITEMALQLGITFGTIPLLGFVLAKILLSAPEVGLHFLDHVAGNSIHPAVIRRARRPLQTVFKWAAWLTGQSRTVKFLVWAYVQWHLFKGSLWPVTDLLQKSVEIVYRHLRVNRSVTARAAEKVNRRDRPARYCSILKLACEIARRHASNDLDRIAGLNYLIKCNTLPTYSETEDCEVAWLRCVAHLPYAAQLELLFNFPDARVHDTENHQGPDLHWIPAWSQVTRLRLQPGLELQRPAWPPSWLERSPDTDYVTAYNGAKKTYDPTTHALLLSCSARVFVARSISCRTSTNQYAVTVAVDVTNQGTSIPCIIAHFFCPHGGSLQGIDERAAYLLITHARDDEGGPISWVVADVLHPPFAKEALLKVAEGKESGFAKIFFLLLIWRLVPGFISSEVFKSDPAVRPDWGAIITDKFGMSKKEAIRTLVVRKLGVLVTDDLRPFTARKEVPHSFPNVPVIFT